MPWFFCMKRSLFTVILSQVDQDGSQLIHLQKYFVHDGQVYNITIYGLHPETLKNEPELNDSLKRIIQSFAFIESPAMMALNCPLTFSRSDRRFSLIYNKAISGQ